MWERDGLPSWIPEVKLCNTLIFQDNVSLMKIKHKFKLRGFLSFFFFPICTGTISSLPPLFLPQNFSGKVSAEYFPWTSDMHPYRKASHFCIVGVFCSYFWNNDTLVVISKLWLISVMKTSMVRKFIRASKTNSQSHVVSSYIILRLKSDILLVNLILLNRGKF